MLSHSISSFFFNFYAEALAQKIGFPGFAPGGLRFKGTGMAKQIFHPLKQLPLLTSLKYLYDQMTPRIQDAFCNLQNLFGDFKRSPGVDQAAAAGARRRITENHIKRAELDQCAEDRLRKDIPLEKAVSPTGRLRKLHRLEIHCHHLALRPEPLQAKLAPASRRGSKVQDLLTRLEK